MSRELGDTPEICVLEPEGVVVAFDSAAYRLDAIKKASYKFTDRCYVLIDTPNGGEKVRVRLEAKKLLENPAHLAGQFCNEVLDQELRETVAAETEGVRNLILAQAFSATNLINSDLDTTDYEHDPRRIAAPDKKKTDS